MTYPNTELQTHLASIGACEDAREWAESRTPQQAWDDSPRAEWLLWWAGITLGTGGTGRNSHTSLVKAACLCARTALPHVTKGDLRPLLAIEAAEAWAADPTEVNLDQCKAAARAAWAAEAAAWAARAAEAADVDLNRSHLEMCRLIRTVLVCPL
jgi:hypothetical protein